MSAPERCNCGAEDCPRCYPLNCKQATVTELYRADALADIVDDHLDTSYAFELVVAALSTNKQATAACIERLYTQVEQMLKSHYADTDMVAELAQDIANERSR